MTSQIQLAGGAESVRVKIVHSNHSYPTDRLEDARLAVLGDLGSGIPKISFEKFLNHLAPPQPPFDLEATMRSLQSGSDPVLTTNRWSNFSTAPKDSKSTEDEVFRPMPDIFQQVVAAIVTNSDKLNDDHRTVDFLQKPSKAPISIVAHNDSRPDGYLVLKDRMHKEGKKDSTFWADIVLPCEYKRGDGDEEMDDDVRKCVWSLQYIMREDPRRRAVFGMTIENSTTRMWFCCRSAVVVSEPFDFINEPKKLVKLFAAFAFADPTSLGFDPTIQPVTGNMGQFFITIHPNNNKQSSRRFKTTEILSSYGAEPLRGRGTRVFRVIEIDREGNETGLPVVLKDIWIDRDRTREGDILASLLAEAGREDSLLVKKYFLTTVCHGDVRTGLDKFDDTTDALMRGLKIGPNSDSLFKLQRNVYVKKPRTPTEGRSEGFRPISLPQARLSYVRYAHKFHYRIVFEEEGTTIDRVKSLPEVMTVLSETTSALRLLRKLGWVHRDVSTGNILLYNGGVKLADLEYAKKMGDSRHHGTRTGTMHFMSVEVAAQRFLFGPKPGTSLTDIDEYLNKAKTSVGMAQTAVPFSHNHLHDLESLWWVAVWVVFNNYFSDRTSSGDPPSFQDVEQQLKVAGILFPPVFKSGDRQNGFQTDMFKETYNKLPDNKKDICGSLDLLRQFLIMHYSVVEARYPLSVDTDSSANEIYDGFTRIFSNFKTPTHDLVLDSISKLHEKMLKERKGLGQSQSTNDTGIAQKTAKK